MPFNWRRVLRLDPAPLLHQDSWFNESRLQLLPTHTNGQDVVSAIPAPEVTKVCLRLRHLIEECVPCELEEDTITNSHSSVITEKVVHAAREAGGEDYRGCVLFCLLVNTRWFKHQALVELWDADLHLLRAVACEVVAKRIIESEEDHEYLLHVALPTRYSILVRNKVTPPTNVIEKAVDLHAVRVIASSGYQKCINYLWRGWLVQDENDPSVFVEYQDRDNTTYWAHLDPDRIRAPIYQNAVQLLVSFVYLALYTMAINSINPEADLDFVEWLLYIFTAGFMIDESIKLWKVGYRILGFWNAMSWSLYAFLTTSLVLRFWALEYPPGELRWHYNTMSYNCLSFCAPFFWIRLMLYLDSFRFFGAMLVVLKVMMKESIIFFALLVIVIIGFLQAFIGLDFANDNHADSTVFIVQHMAAAILGSPDFEGFDTRFGDGPWALILYYLFTFIVMVILLNVLIALYNSAYEDIYLNANDEYMAMFSHKTMQFVRAPDENVYIPPFNLIEIFLCALPFEWWMPKAQYERLNDIYMAVIYSPILLVSAFFERRWAIEIHRNRSRGDDDDSAAEEWDQLAEHVDMDFEQDGWSKLVNQVKSNVAEEPAVLEVKKLREEVEVLKGLIEGLTRVVVAGNATGAMPASLSMSPSPSQARPPPSAPVMEDTMVEPAGASSSSSSSDGD